jgi:hypothetical protein
MKNKTKKFLPFLIFFLAIGLNSCSEDNESSEQSNIETIIEKVSIQKSNSGDIGTIELRVDMESEIILKYTITDNLIANSGLSSAELYAKIDGVLGGDDRSIDMNNQIFMTKFDDPDPSTGDKWQACKAGCVRDFTDENGDKIKGRGKCRTNCTIAAIIDIVDG